MSFWSLRSLLIVVCALSLGVTACDGNKSKAPEGKGGGGGGGGGAATVEEICKQSKLDAKLCEAGMKPIRAAVDDKVWAKFAECVQKPDNADMCNALDPDGVCGGDAICCGSIGCQTAEIKEAIAGGGGNGGPTPPMEPGETNVDATEITDDTPAGGTARSARPGNSWAYTGEGPGFFLLAASSQTSGSRGGDVIRRVNLDGSVEEHDYNPELDGAQGQHLEVKGALKSGFKRTLFKNGLFVGSICGFVPGPEKKVIALAKTGGFIIDPFADGAAQTPSAAFYFGSNANNVCDGVFVPETNRLYAIDVGALGGTSNQKGVFSIEITADATGDLGMSEFYEAPQGYGFSTFTMNRFQGIDVWDGVAYLVETGARPEGETDVGVHRVPLNAKGQLLFSKASQILTENPIKRDDGCGMNGDNNADGKVVEVDGKPVFISGGTTGLVAIDISTENMQKIDMDPKRPGTQFADIVDLGRGGNSFEFSADGEHLYAGLHCRSKEKRVKVGSKEVWQHQVVDINLKDVKNGAPKVEKKGFGIEYIEFMKGLQKKGAKDTPFLNMLVRNVAASPDYLIVVGAGTGGNSGLSMGGDVVIYDFEEGKPLTFVDPDPKNASSTIFGLDLGKGDEDHDQKQQTVYDAIWIP